MKKVIFAALTWLSPAVVCSILWTDLFLLKCFCTVQKWLSLTSPSHLSMYWALLRWVAGSAILSFRCFHFAMTFTINLYNLIVYNSLFYLRFCNGILSPLYFYPSCPAMTCSLVTDLVTDVSSNMVSTILP